MVVESSGADRLGRVCVLGIGRTGVAVARHCLSLVASGRVDSVTVVGGASSHESEESRSLVADGADVILGSEEVRGEYDLGVASPGIPVTSSFFLSATKACTEVIGEPELAWRESPERWIGITGTNGKTTTTTLVRDLIRAGGSPAQEVGNIGTIAIGEVDGRVEGGWFVAELSSFQLATTRLLHPRVAVLLNVTPDHLAWHGTMEAYAAAKERIFANLVPTDLAVLSDDDETCRAIEGRLEARGLRVCHLSVSREPDGADAAFVRAGRLVCRLGGEEHELVGVDELSIKGEHNLENALAASACALEVGVPVEDVSRGLIAFRPLEHRIEPAGTLGGVSLVDDSKATNTDAVEKALTAFPKGHVILLLGGHDKGCELDSFASAVVASVKSVVCFGEAGPRFGEAMRSAAGGTDVAVLSADHMADALDRALDVATAGDVVLLSPACSSFDEFSGFEERGDVFKRLCAERVARAGSEA